jgi:hypothetical protein
MHSIVELEITDGELGLADVVMQGVKLRLVQAVVLSQLGVQSRDGIEVLALIGIVEGLAEIEIPQGPAGVGTGGEGWR